MTRKGEHTEVSGTGRGVSKLGSKCWHHAGLLRAWRWGREMVPSPKSHKAISRFFKAETKDIAMQGTTGCLLHKGLHSRAGDVADSPNAKKQTQRSRQNDETEEYVPKERIIKNHNKRTKQNGYEYYAR